MTPPPRKSPQRLAVSRLGMVSTAHYRATEAAVQVLAEGGNAVDAAVTAAFALGVCEPAASGLGGQTMMLVHLAGRKRTFALDGSSRAPNRATPEALSREDRRVGYRATTVPSTPAVLRYALERYGNLKLPRVIGPAIDLAEFGVEVSPLLHSLMRRNRKTLAELNGGRIFLRAGDRPHAAGSILKQPVLAETLRRLSKRGIRDFYSGRIARAIHADMVRNGGLLRRDDLAQVPRPIERRPLTGHFEAARVFTFPPPGAGRPLIEMLNILGHIPRRDRDPETPRGALVLAEIIRRALLDRRDRPFDPNYYLQVQKKRMLSDEYAAKVAKTVRTRVRSHGETTHLSVMDRQGNAVALTQSIEKTFGACVATPELGFLYNNYTSAFEYEDISHPYYLRPNAVPWASVTPTILFRGRRPWVVIGSPGSERIASTVAQVLLRLRTHAPLEAVEAPRMHCALDGTVSLEASRMRDDIPETLRARGFTIDAREPYAFHLGCVQMVLRDGDRFTGVADPRRDGSAAGPKI